MCYNQNMKKKSGFTLIEVIVLSIFLLVVGVLSWLQKIEIQEQSSDTLSKTTINAVYYNLEEVLYKQNGFYPKTIGEDNLKAMDPNLLTDRNGVVLGEEGSLFRYEPTSCNGDQCQHYTLRADLIKEDDFVKKSKN